MVHTRFRRFAAPLLLVLLLPSVASDPHPAASMTESLVEGHTVFSFLTVVDSPEVARARAVTVEVSGAESGGAEGGSSANVEAQRSPGVLWTNHQFLVEPSVKIHSRSLPDGAIGTQKSRAHFAASIMTLVHRSHGPYDVTAPCGGAMFAVSEGYPDPRGGELGGAIMAASTSQVTLGYRESYLVTDPNDHVWITDLYDARTALTLDGVTTEKWWPVWVTNVLGSPLFVPDFEGPCPAPYYDVPPAGYAEPSMNGYCFDGRSDLSKCTDGAPPMPRAYNGVFYFRWEDLTMAAGPRLHSDAGAPDVNACDAGSIWECPAGDDDMEGFSHPFHPDPSGATVEQADPCPEPFHREGYSWNHGGSTTAESNYWYMGEPRYTGKGVCDALHDARRVDIYYDPEWRPQEPLVRRFAVQDLGGAEDVFGQI